MLWVLRTLQSYGVDLGSAGPIEKKLLTALRVRTSCESASVELNLAEKWLITVCALHNSGGSGLACCQHFLVYFVVVLGLNIRPHVLEASSVLLSCILSQACSK